ncbi:MAG: double-strand break repair helicase AddA [Pseudomonadota bacterium]
MTRPVERDAASERQVEAADPGASTWVSANAGSGKTRVLTDRVARLLLRGAAPQNVLCLTYTKAAASEMQNRLFDRLGAWSMAEDGALAATLAELGVDAAPSAPLLAEARRLFARAIETPGGLKIQTIHSFCAAILRRFPLEADLSPSFREMDDRMTEQVQQQVLDRLAQEEQDSVAEMAALISDEGFGPLCNALQRHRHGFPPQPDWQATLMRFGLPTDASEEGMRAHPLRDVSVDHLRRMAGAIANDGKRMAKLAGHLTRAAGASTNRARFEALCDGLLVADRSRVPDRLLTKGARAALGPEADALDILANGVCDAAEQLRAFKAARHTHTAHRFAARFLPAYRHAKTEQGLLDFDDLIECTEHLLSKRGIADWVLYRLDGGIDHLLVDEAQDTSPAQWRVIELLTREFTAGEGLAAPGERTLFVVGDVKQSIYSFQGAEPESFFRMKDTFAERLDRINVGLVPLELEYSFRSAPEILRLVDAVFAATGEQGLGERVQHRAFKAELPGRVELWPLIEKPEKEDETHWYDPVDRISPEHHHAQLAREVAEAARHMVAEGQLLDEDRTARKVTAGDILILVQSRGTLFHETIRACKAAGLDVAGADVLKLGEELAVRDLTAFLAFLDLPEDSLSLATILRSPLCGWCEAELYNLAAGRKEAHLWASLRRQADAFPQTHAMLADLRDAADYLRPYELLERILTVHDGRRRLVARLGPEAGDGIDALLARALAHERTDVPSLTGFLALQETQSANVKRQAEARSTKLRVMTVHGAKGLEAPIVILPDTADQRRQSQYGDKILRDADGTALWSVTKAEAPRLLTDLREGEIVKQREEARRLLYVAMTRAEQWLVVAGSGKASEESWYRRIEAGLDRAGGAEDGAGKRVLQSLDWPGAARAGLNAAETKTAPNLSAWLTRSAPAPPRPEQRLAASDLGGAKVLSGEAGSTEAGLSEAGLSEAEAKARGTRIHLLLEHLPGHPTETWADRAAMLCAPDLCPPADLDEAARVLQNAELAPLFAPSALSEVGVTARLAELGTRRLSGQIDRLLVCDDRVLAVDFKTNTVVPETPSDVPEGLLRQMGAYAAALAEIYPDRCVETALLWTKTAALMRLPAALTAAALSRTGADLHGEVKGPAA